MKQTGPCTSSSFLTHPTCPCSGPPCLARVTVVLLVAEGSMAALGTESGSIFFLDMPTLKLLEEQTLSPDEVLQR